MENLYILTAPRAKQFSEAELEGFRYAEVTPPQYTLVEEPLGDTDLSYYWSDTDQKLPFSTTFLTATKPSRIFNVDFDQDGDEDMVLQNEDGSTSVSYNVTAQLEGAELVAKDNPKIDEQLTFWLEEQYPGITRCLTPSQQWTHVMMAAGALQMYERLDKYFSDLVDIDPEIARAGAHAILKQYSQKIAVAAERENPNPKQLVEDDGTSSVWAGLGLLQERQVACEPILTDATQTIEEFRKAIASIEEKAKCTAEQIGKKDGGIGILIDGGKSDQDFVTVTGLADVGGALQSGIRFGDRITKVDGKAITALKREGEILAKAGVLDCVDCSWRVQNAIAGAYGSKVDLTVERGGRVRTFSVPRTFNLTPLRFAGLVP